MFTLHLLIKENIEVLDSLKIISTVMLLKGWKIFVFFITDLWKFVIDDDYEVFKELIVKSSWLEFVCGYFK